MLNKSRTCSL